jgi:hypothetical protein
MIFVKTFNYSKPIGKNLNEIEVALSKNSSSKYYCSRSVNNMNEVSNEAICNGITYDISMYINIVFPVTDSSWYKFDIPMGFCGGVLVKVDG